MARGRWWVPWFLLSLGVGAAIGLAVGWRFWPRQPAFTDLAHLRQIYQEDYLLMVSVAYWHDGDLARAKERLSYFDEKEIPERLANLLHKAIAEEASLGARRSLARLAQALGASSADIVAYMATPALVHTPTSWPTSTRSPTLPPTRTPPLATGTVTPSATGTTSLPTGTVSATLLTSTLDKRAVTASATWTPGALAKTRTALPTGTIAGKVTLTTSPTRTPSPSVRRPTATLTGGTPGRRTPTALVTPSRQASPTRQIAGPTPTRRGSGVQLIEQKQLSCQENDLPGHILIRVQNSQEQGLPGVRLKITWAEGEDSCVTGLHPDKDPGYADYWMTQGITYTVSVADVASDIATGLVSFLPEDECPEGPKPISWQVVFERAK